MPQDDFHADVLGGARVLIIDDSFFIAADLDLIIEDAGGRTVALAGTIEQALQVLAQERVDAVILEHKLKEGDANAVLDALRRRGIPVLIYTGTSVSSDFQGCYPEAMVVEKPAMPEVLLGALRSSLMEAYPLAA